MDCFPYSYFSGPGGHPEDAQGLQRLYRSRVGVPYQSSTEVQKTKMNQRNSLAAAAIGLWLLWAHPCHLHPWTA